MKTNTVKNKRGKAGVMVLLTILTVAVLGIGGIFVYQTFGRPVGQQIVGPDGVPQPTTVQVISTGKAASAKFAAFDNTADSRTQVGDVLLYVWELDSPSDTSSGSRIIQNGVTMSATDRTSVATSTGKYLWAVAFNESRVSNGGYYGSVRKNLKIETETPQFDLEVWNAIDCDARNTTICGRWTFDGVGAEVEVDAGSGEFGNSARVNLTGVGSAGTFSLDNIEWENNQTDSAFRLGGIAFNSTSGTPVDDIQIAGETAPLTKIPNLRRYASATRVHTFKLNEPRLFLEFQSFKTGTVQIRTTATCGTAAAGNPIQVNLLDWGEYTKKADSSYVEGLEDDQDTATDVGVADPTMIFHCKA